MSLTGTLSEFGPIEIIDVIGTLGKSGTLSLRRGADRGLVVFRHGKIVYAASSGLRENLGSMLLARGLITEIELVDALGTQAQAYKERRTGWLENLESFLEDGSPGALASERQDGYPAKSRRMPWGPTRLPAGN